MTQFSVIPVSYEIDGQPYESQLVFDSSSSEARPGLLMAPNWMGISEGAIELAKKAAGSKYAVLVADIYGKSIRPTNADEAGKALMPLRDDRHLLRKRMHAGLEALQGQTSAPIIPGKLAAFGFCAGGMAALELARTGAPLKAVISIHGSPNTPHPDDGQHIQGAVLVLHGAADPLVPKEQLLEFQAEMEAIERNQKDTKTLNVKESERIDWQIVSYGGAMHSFTDPTANKPENGQQYNPTVAARAFKAMANLLDEVF